MFTYYFSQNNKMFQISEIKSYFIMRLIFWVTLFFLPLQRLEFWHGFCFPLSSQSVIILLVLILSQCLGPLVILSIGASYSLIDLGLYTPPGMAFRWGWRLKAKYKLRNMCAALMCGIPYAQNENMCNAIITAISDEKQLFS